MSLMGLGQMDDLMNLPLIDWQVFGELREMDEEDERTGEEVKDGNECFSASLVQTFVEQYNENVPKISRALNCHE